MKQINSGPETEINVVSTCSLCMDFYDIFYSLKDKVEISGREVPMMKKTMILLGLLFVASWAFFPQIVQADLEWKVVKDLDLKTTPLDVTSSADGKWLFILTPGEILVYSFLEGKITDQIPVDRDFDRIASLPRPDMVTISSSAKKTLKIIHLQAVYKIDVTGLPFKGPQDASVTVVVFDDYQ